MATVRVPRRRRSIEIQQTIQQELRNVRRLPARFNVALSPESVARKALRRWLGPDRFEELTGRQWRSAVEAAQREIRRQGP